uniref:Uncharacterized protein n=1 Tax=Kryptolebias marmoratus TaxID=37003 RepID=A0A3Q3AZS1_KRYMA
MLTLEGASTPRVESDAKRARKEKERLRQLSRINIGDQAGRWCAVKTELGIQTLGFFLQVFLTLQLVPLIYL